MSNNGVGLQTPRGTGTSGYVQKNVATGNTEGFRQKRARAEAEEERKEANQRMHAARRNARHEIIEHNKKRSVEVKCMEYRALLEDKGLEDDVIHKMVDTRRNELMAASADAEREDERESSELRLHGMSRREMVEKQDREKDQSRDKGLTGVKDEKTESSDSKTLDKTSDQTDKDPALDSKPTFDRDTKQRPTESVPKYIPRYGKR